MDEQMICEGFDAHNLLHTGGVSMTIMANRSDTHSVPVVCIAIEGNGSLPSHRGGGTPKMGDCSH